jgi:serine/threonine protein kinase
MKANLGKGSFGFVKLALNTKDNKLYAIKCIKKVSIRGEK